jgi:hypothetical protein
VLSISESLPEQRIERVALIADLGTQVIVVVQIGRSQSDSLDDQSASSEACGSGCARNISGANGNRVRLNGYLHFDGCDNTIRSIAANCATPQLCSVQRSHSWCYCCLPVLRFSSPLVYLSYPTLLLRSLGTRRTSVGRGTPRRHVS